MRVAIFAAMVVAAVLLLLTSTATASDYHMLPPVLPIYFEADFVEYTAPYAPYPPYLNGVPPAPFWASRGKTYYDWTRKAMIEERQDFCVNIFPSNNSISNDFPCTFLDVNGTSYLISSGPKSPLPPCCIWGKPWYPAEPDFLRVNVTTKFAAREEWGCGEKADWWINPDIPPPMGPFYFTFRNNTSPQIYMSFSFPGVKGWVQQNFINVRAKQPDPKVWEIPAECRKEDVKLCYPADSDAAEQVVAPRSMGGLWQQRKRN